MQCQMYAKTDGHMILKRIFQLPAQPSHFPGTMESSIFAFNQEIQVFEG